MVNNTINLDALNNIQPINLTFEGLNSSSSIISIVQNVTKEEVGNFWFNISIFIIFLFMIYIFYRQDKKIILDITRSVLISSGWCLFISVAFLLSKWIDTILPVVWFTTIFFISFIGVLGLKPKSL